MVRWSNLQTDFGVFIMRLDEQSDDNTGESTFTIWVSDMKFLWNETLTRQDIFERFAHKNPALSIENDDVIQSQLIAALGSLDNAPNVKNPNIDNEPQNDDAIEVQVKYHIFDDFEVDFEWRLKKCSPEEFFEQITKPLLRQVGELQDKNKELIGVAKKKDDEIDQYKLEVGQIEIRKKFVTKKFEEEKFELQTQMFSFGIDRFESLIGQLPKKVAIDEPKASKDESSSAAEQPNQSTAAVKHKSPKGKRATRKLYCGPVIKPGEIKYENDSDDDDDNTSKSAPNKRTRQSF